MKPDPRVRRDGKCYTCKGPRPDAAKAGKHPDPFCSMECAREFHGVSLPGKAAMRAPKQTAKQKAAKKKAQQNFSIRPKSGERASVRTRGDS